MVQTNKTIVLKNTVAISECKMMHNVGAFQNGFIQRPIRIRKCGHILLHDGCDKSNIGKGGSSPLFWVHFIIALNKSKWNLWFPSIGASSMASVWLHPWYTHSSDVIPKPSSSVEKVVASKMGTYARI